MTAAVLDDVQFEPESEPIARKLRAQEDSANAQRLPKLVAKAQAIARPEALCIAGCIESRTEDALRAVGNAGASDALSKMRSNVDSGIFSPVQEAAVVALGTDPARLAQRNATCRDRLELLLQCLRPIGLHASRPEATFYLWAPLPERMPEARASAWTSESFVQILLEETGIVVAPGSFFGTAGGGIHQSLSYGAYGASRRSRRTTPGVPDTGFSPRAEPGKCGL